MVAARGSPTILAAHPASPDGIALPEFALFLVQRFFQKFGALLEHKPVQLRQIGGIVPDRILHQEYSLDSYAQDVIIRVGLVLEKLDNGDN